MDFSSEEDTHFSKGGGVSVWSAENHPVKAICCQMLAPAPPCSRPVQNLSQLYQIKNNKIYLPGIRRYNIRKIISNTFVIRIPGFAHNLKLVRIHD